MAYSKRLNKKIKSKNLSVSLIRRLIIPIGIILIIIFVAANVIMSLQYQNNSNNRIQANINSTVNQIDFAIEYQAQGLASLFKLILADPELPNALKTQNRELLYEKWNLTFEKLRKDNNITHFYFFDSSRVCFLRVHKPEKSGDIINRYTAIEAERTGSLTKGIELGPLGTFTLRVVQPVFHEEELLGYVELGKEIEDILDGIKNPVILTINKEFLDRKLWEDGMRHLGRDSNWEKFNDSVSIYPNESELPISFDYIEKTISRNNELEKNSVDEYFIDGETWEIISNPLLDVSGQEVGSLFIISNITEEKSDYYMMMIFGGGITGVLLLSLIGLMFFILYKTERVIKKQQTALRESEEFQSATLGSIGDGVIVCDCSSRIIKMNKVAERLTGWSTNNAFGKPIVDVFNILNNRTRDVVVNPVMEALEKGIIVELESHTALISKDGTEYQIADSCSPIRGAENEIIGAVLVFRDVTDEYKHSELLKKSEEKHRLLFDNAVSAIGVYEIVFDSNNKPVDYIYLKVNKSFETHTGLKTDDVIGRTAMEVFPGIEKTTLIDIYGKVVLSGESVSFEYYFEPIKGHFFINAYRLDDKQFATVFTNITARVQSERALLEAEKEYRILVENSYDIIYRLDINGLITYLSPAVKPLLGYEAEQLIGKPFSEIVHTDDISVCLKFLQKVRDSKTRQEGVEYRLKHLNGFWRWHTSCATSLVDDDGLAQGFVGNSRDVTNRIEIENQLHNQKEQFELAIKGSNDGIWDWNLLTNELYMSPRWKEQLGYKDDELANEFETFEERIHPDDKEMVTENINIYLSGESLTYSVEFRMLHKDGQYRWIWARGEALRNSDGKVYRMAGSHTDVTEGKEEAIKIEYYSIHDSLTGLFNRTYLTKLDYSATNFTVFSFDIDKLKYVNDTFGHSEGDKLIIKVTAIIKKCFDESDIIIRMGGDEFIAVVENCDAKRAENIRKLLLDELYKINQERVHDDYTICFSIGYAVSRDCNCNLKALIKEADLMMYREKNEKKKTAH